MATIPQTRQYVGFSTQGTNSLNQEFADLELVKRDLLNIFYTKPGERIMMPTYGCNIWNLLFEPFDDLIKDTVVNECQSIIASDPRVKLLNTTVTQVDQGLNVQMELLYVPWNAITTFSLSFDQRASNF